MDKKTQKAIRNRIVCKIWGEMKAEITMADLARVIDIPLATLFRIIKQNNEQPKKENNTI